MFVLKVFETDGESEDLPAETFLHPYFPGVLLGENLSFPAWLEASFHISAVCFSHFEGLVVFR